MASTIDFSTLTLNSEEARSTAEVVQEQVYSAPEIAQAFGIQTGVEMDRYIPILGQYGLVGKVDPGSCGVNAETGQVPTTEKQWTPKLISFRLAHCQADVDSLLKFWKKSRIAAGTWEQVDNEMMAFITDRVTDATKQSVLRIADFGATTHSPVGDGAGDQLLTAGTTKTYFNMLNGRWQQIFTDQAGAAVSYRATITENAAADYATQLALASDAALNVFRKLYENIDPRAFNGQNLVFQVTRSLFNNWQSYMEDKSLVFQLDRTENGSTTFSYRGIPILVRNDWDRFIRTYFDNGVGYDLPHRAILTDINNTPIGTSDTESITTLDSFYDKTLKTHYIDVAYKLDQKNLLEYNMAVAY
jgi:hypothetical protein